LIVAEDNHLIPILDGMIPATNELSFEPRFPNIPFDVPHFATDHTSSAGRFCLEYLLHPEVSRQGAKRP